MLIWRSISFHTISRYVSSSKSRVFEAGKAQRIITWESGEHVPPSAAAPHGSRSRYQSPPVHFGGVNPADGGSGLESPVCGFISGCTPGKAAISFMMVGGLAPWYHGRTTLAATAATIRPEITVRAKISYCWGISGVDDKSITGKSRNIWLVAMISLSYLSSRSFYYYYQWGPFSKLNKARKARA